MEWHNRMLPPSSMAATKRMNIMRAAIDVVERKMLKDMEDTYDRAVFVEDELANLHVGDRVTIVTSMDVQIVNINGEDATIDVDIIDRGNGGVFGRLRGVPITAVSKIGGD